MRTILLITPKESIKIEIPIFGKPKISKIKTNKIIGFKAKLEVYDEQTSHNDK